MNPSGFIALPSSPSYKPAPTSISTFKYTPVGSVAEAQNDVATVKLYYDSFGRVAKETSNAGNVLYTYNDLERRIGITFPNGRNIVYSYSSAGTLIGMSQNSAGVQYTLVIHPCLLHVH